MPEVPHPSTHIPQASEAPPVERPLTQEKAEEAGQEKLPTYFLSYAGTDRDIAAQLVQGLQGVGVQVWWDQQKIAWGMSWVQELQKALAHCQGFLLLVGASGVRKWVQPEFEYAFKRHIEQGLPIYPLLLPGVTPEALPPFLSTIQAKMLPNSLSQLPYHTLAAELSGGVPANVSRFIPPHDPDVCPFPGLESFGEAEAPFFVGRQVRESIDAGCIFTGSAERANPLWSKRGSSRPLKKDGLARPR